jgi:hypothetical protein
MGRSRDDAEIGVGYGWQAVAPGLPPGERGGEDTSGRRRGLPLRRALGMHDSWRAAKCGEVAQCTSDRDSFAEHR